MTQFETLGIESSILQAIRDIGYEEPTPVQVQAIPEVLAGKDIIAQAQTGTGKTAAFGIPLIQKMDTTVRGIQGLVLTPTRELCVQVAEELTKLSKNIPDIRVAAVYGGQPIDRQIASLRDVPHIVVGTPGRVLDHLDRGTIRLYHVRMTVLDEADEMLDMGFRDEIENILDQVPSGRQMVLFSATMPPKIMSLATSYLKDPVHVQVVHNQQLTVEKIAQYVVEVAESAKAEILARLLEQYKPQLSMVFCNTKKRVNEVVFALQSRGVAVDGLHGDMKQSDRDACMEKFRQGVVQVLVATDVASRGLDISNVEAVFNYDFPNDQEYYVHRIGRTGRAGRGGMSFTFVFGRERQILRDMAAQIGADIQPVRIPTMDDVQDARIEGLIKTVKSSVEEGGLDVYTKILDRLSETLNPDVVGAALLKLHLGPIQSEQKTEEPLFSVTPEDLAQACIRPGKARLMLNVGRNDGVSVKEILTLFATETGLTSYFLGDIILGDTATYVDVPEDQIMAVFRGLNGIQYNDNPLSARLIHKERDAEQLQRDMAEQRSRRPDKKRFEDNRKQGHQNRRSPQGQGKFPKWQHDDSSTSVSADVSPRPERRDRNRDNRGGRDYRKPAAVPYFPASSGTPFRGTDA